jgi:predicted small secreted protein
VRRDRRPRSVISACGTNRRDRVMALLRTSPNDEAPSGNKPGITRKDADMHKTFIIGLTALSLVAVVPLLSACHTTAGAGQDISATGHAIDKAATKATP